MIISLEFRNGSFLKTFLGRYNFYSFRPVYTLGSFVTMGYSNNPANYPLTIFVFYICVYSLFVFSIYKLLQEIFSLQNLSLRGKWLLLCFSNILITCLYFLTTERIEIFAWVSASIIHLVPVVFVLLSAWLIIKERKKTDYILLTIASAFVAGGAEHIAASVIASLLLIIITLFYSERKNKGFYAENKPRIIKSIFFLIVLSAFLFIFISNPGIRLHYNEVHRQTDGFATHHGLNAFEAIKLFCKPHKLIGLLFLLVFWMLFQNTFTVISSPKIKLNYFFIPVFCVAGITITTSILAYHTLSVGRIWFAFDVALFVLLSGCIVKFIASVKKDSMILHAGAAIFLITLVLFDIRHIPALLNFSSQHDKIIYSLQQKTPEETIVLKSLPNPDLTNQVPLSSDPNNDVNQLFCRFYNIKAKVSVKN